jgi:hypothetical protein
VENERHCQNAAQRRDFMRKPDAWQVFQAISFLLCFCLALRVTSGLDGTEFSGGWLTGPLLSMADVGIVLFVPAFLLIFVMPRLAAAIGLLSSLLCVPLCCFFISPLPFAHVFARGHEFKVQPTPGFHWHAWPVVTLFAAALACYLCFRRFTVSGRMPSPPQTRLA